jgi:hypothetical protein
LMDQKAFLAVKHWWTLYLRISPFHLVSPKIVSQ